MHHEHKREASPCVEPAAPLQETRFTAIAHVSELLQDRPGFTVVGRSVWPPGTAFVSQLIRIQKLECFSND